MKNIILIGMRGSGKTTVAKILAEKLSMTAVEMDAVLENQFGETIKSFVEKDGWPAFRKAESELAAQISARDGQVVSTGGGVILDPANVEAFRKSGTIIFLFAPVSKLRERIGDANHLPTLSGGKNSGEELEKVWDDRKELYEKSSDYRIDTEDLSADQVVAEIIKRLHS